VRACKHPLSRTATIGGDNHRGNNGEEGRGKGEEEEAHPAGAQEQGAQRSSC